MTVGNKNIAELQLVLWVRPSSFASLKLTEREQLIAGVSLKKFKRLGFWLMWAGLSNAGSSCWKSVRW